MSTKTGDVTLEEVAAIIADNRPARSALRKAELIVKLFEASHAAQAERIASLEVRLNALVRDSLANDFNNCWDSYTSAVALLSGKASA